jgi:hypothetical protein
MNRNYCITSALVFSLVAIMHAWRFAADIPVQIGTWNVSRGLSGVAVIVAALLAIWAFRSAGSAASANGGA